LLPATTHRYGRNLPTLPKTLSDLPPQMSRREALDRYSQHTQHCPDCKRALGRIEAALPVIAGAALAALAAAGYFLLSGAAPPLSGRVVGGVAVAGLAALVYQKLLQFRQKFIFEDYVHADKN